MAAISKSWVTIADGAVDPDSPGTTTLFTGFRDNLIHLREWLGAGFTAGAVQNHRHDGVDSALVPIGPNLVRNGSFEDGEGGWTFTDFSGGSHAISTSAHRHGAKSAQITSTVLANGGGEALTNEFMTVSETDTLTLKFWMGASVANVSSKLEITWYNNVEASISTSVIQSYTNTPTTLTFHGASVAAPSNARFFKAKITGGIPGSGSATGTITFDGIEAGSVRIAQGNILAGAVAQGNIAAGAVGQAQLKTTTGDATTNTTLNVTLPGGEYGFYPNIATDTGTGTAHWGGQGDGTAAPAASTGVATLEPHFFLGLQGGTTARVRQRYVQASPPYDLGDGEVPLFVFAVVSSLGVIESVWSAPDPVWANNGPTDIRVDFVDAFGKAFQIVRDISPALKASLANRATRQAALLELADLPLVPREVTQAVKQADMPLIPHPFLGNNLTGKTIVMLDPVSALVAKLRDLHSAGENINMLLHEDYLRIGNTPLPRSGPPGVMVVIANFKLT